MPAKKDFGYSFACDGPGRGWVGNTQASWRGGIYIARCGEGVDDLQVVALVVQYRAPLRRAPHVCRASGHGGILRSFLPPSLRAYLLSLASSSSHVAIPYLYISVYPRMSLRWPIPTADGQS